MIPLPYATKENYKVMLYRLCDTDAEKVNKNTVIFSLRFEQLSVWLCVPELNKMCKSCAQFRFYGTIFVTHFNMNVVKVWDFIRMHIMRFTIRMMHMWMVMIMRCHCWFVATNVVQFFSLLFSIFCCCCYCLTSNCNHLQENTNYCGYHHDF